MNDLSYKKSLLAFVVLSTFLCSSPSQAMENDKRDEKEDLRSPSVKKKPKTTQEVYGTYVLNEDSLPNVYLSMCLKFLSPHLSEGPALGRLARVSKACHRALHGKNPNCWADWDIEVDLGKPNGGLFDTSYPIKGHRVTVNVSDTARLEEIKGFVEWVSRQPPSHLVIQNASPDFNFKEEARDNQKLAALGMAFFLNQERLSSVRSLELFNFRTVSDFASGNRFVTFEVFTEGLSPLFPDLQKLVVDNCSFFDCLDWEADPRFAEGLTNLTDLTVRSHTSHVRDLEQYLKPTMEHLCLESLEIDRDFSVWDGIDEDERQHMAQSLFRDMPRLKSIKLSDIHFQDIETQESLPCTESELMSLLSVFKGLTNLEALNIKGGNWVAGANRSKMTATFLKELAHLSEVTLDW